MRGYPSTDDPRAWIVAIDLPVRRGDRIGVGFVATGAMLDRCVMVRPVGYHADRRRCFLMRGLKIERVCFTATGAEWLAWRGRSAVALCKRAYSARELGHHRRARVLDALGWRLKP